MSTFKYTTDRYEGILIKSIEQNIETDQLVNQLSECLRDWESERKRGIWFRVDIKQSDWVPHLTKNGFVFHHAKEDYVMLIKWLPKNEECNIPKYAHNLIGVGALVISEDDEVLVVKERFFITKNWKLPGGYVETGENIVDAAMREVYEEANIQTNFEAIVSFRHGHGSQFGCSDMYIVVCLKANTKNVQKCEREIAEMKWMKFSEYLTHPEVHSLNRYFLKKYLENKADNIKIDCKHGVHEILNKAYVVYHANNEK